MQQAESKELKQELAQQPGQKFSLLSLKKNKLLLHLPASRLDTCGVAAWESMNQLKVFGLNPKIQTGYCDLKACSEFFIIQTKHSTIDVFWSLCDLFIMGPLDSTIILCY